MGFVELLKIKLGQLWRREAAGDLLEEQVGVRCCLFHGDAGFESAEQV